MSVSVSVHIQYVRVQICILGMMNPKSINPQIRIGRVSERTLEGQHCIQLSVIKGK